MPNEVAEPRPIHRQLLDKISLWMLLVTGIFGAILGILDVFFEPSKLAAIIPFAAYLKDVSTLTLIMVSLLAIASGLERYASFDEIRNLIKRNDARNQGELSAVNNNLNVVNDNLNLIKRDLADKIRVNTFLGREPLYKEIGRVLSACQGNEVIKATSLVGHEKEGTEEHAEYLKILTTKIKNSKPDSVGMFYQVVLTTQEEKGFKEAVKKRLEAFSAQDVIDRLDMRQSDNLWGMDVLIIGTKHLFIAFPAYKRSHTLRLGVRISDDDLVTLVSRWYDEFVWHGAPAVPESLTNLTPITGGPRS